MDVTITSRHLDLTDEMRDYISGKLQNAVKMFPHVVRSVQVTIEQENYLYMSEAIADLTVNKTLTATSQDKDMRTGVDTMLSKLSEQMRRLKEKVEDHHRHGRPPRR